jgi:membrane protease YdiL (CAAX protease family)
MCSNEPLHHEDLRVRRTVLTVLFMTHPGRLIGVSLFASLAVGMLVQWLCGDDMMAGNLAGQGVQIAIILRAARRERAFDSLGLGPVSWRFVAGGVLIGLGIWQVDTLLHAIIPGYPATSSVPAIYLSSTPVIMLLGLTLAAPIAEELCFRGLLLPILLRRFKPTTAVVLQALAFGVVHVYPLQILSATLAGLVLGALALRTRSLIPGMIVHAANNAIVFALIMSPSFDYTTVAWIAGPIAAMAAGVALVAIRPRAQLAIA